jgi:hypothetical protein
MRLYNYVYNKGLMEKSDKEEKCGSKWACSCFLFPKNIVNLLASVTYLPSHRQAGGPTINIVNISHPNDLCKNVSPRCCLVAKVIHIQCLRRQICVYKGKVKGFPKQARCGPEGSRRFRLPDSMTFGTLRWWGCQHHAPAALPPGMFLVLIFTRGWVDARAMVRSEGSMSLKNPVTPLGIDCGTVRLVAQRLNHYATPGPLLATVL